MKYELRKFFGGRAKVKFRPYYYEPYVVYVKSNRYSFWVSDDAYGNLEEAQGRVEHFERNFERWWRR